VDDWLVVAAMVRWGRECFCGSLICVAWLDRVDGCDGVGAADVWVQFTYLGSNGKDEGYCSRGMLVFFNFMVRRGRGLMRSC
jgi:hypothetical protein